MAAEADLISFIAARLDEDEGAARLAAREGGTWKQDHPGSGAAISSLGGTVVYDEGSPDEYQAAHIARHDPARALREAGAKRAILDEHRPGYPATFPKPSGQPTCGVCHAGGWDWEPEQWPCRTIRALAATYDDHPDYRQEWAPLG